MEYDWIKIKKPLLKWYYANYRKLPWRENKNPYCVWISEIMLQQTRVEAVKGYYARFLKELPDIESLSEVSEEHLLKLWEGLGYYNRARNLKKAALCMKERYNGAFPKEYTDVIDLPGIGEYTAGAICSICFDAPIPAVDGNVLRVSMRLMNCYDNIDDLKVKRRVKQDLVPLYEHGDCGDITQALMEIGAIVCVPGGVPKCDRCPLSSMCQSFNEGTFMDLPVRKKKKTRKIVDKTVFILHDGEYYGIRKRDSDGLLANMWEFYQKDGAYDAAEAVSFIGECGFEPVLLEKQIPYTHIFSHVEWRMTAYYISCRNQKSDLKWIHKSEFDNKYALPTAFRYFLEGES